jgi:hypothetical protein
VADLDSDGQPDVVWGRYDVALNSSTGAVKWRSGDRVWRYRRSRPEQRRPARVVVGRSDQLIYNRTGGVVWTRNPFGAGGVRTLAVADLETDGQLEVVVGRASDGATRQLSVYEPNGSVRPGWPARHSGEVGNGWGMFNENVAVADMNGDGSKEVFGPTDTHYITALDASGNQLPQSVYLGRSVWSGVGSGPRGGHAAATRCAGQTPSQLRGQRAGRRRREQRQRPRLIVVGNVYNCGDDPTPRSTTCRSSSARPRAGALWPDPDHRPTGASSPPLSRTGVVDSGAPRSPTRRRRFRRDHLPLVRRQMRYWLDKTQHGAGPTRSPAGLTGDTFPLRQRARRGRPRQRLPRRVIFVLAEEIGGRGQLHVLDYLGHELHRVNLPAPSIGETYNGGLGAPTLANIDGDPDLEVVVGTVSSGVVAYDLPGTAGARILWNTGRGGFLRSGRIPSAVRRAPNFDGDLKADAVVYHQPTGLWYARQSSTGTTFSVGYGGPGYQAVPGDYDGDGKTDAAVYQTSSGLWFVRQSSTGTTFTMGFGGAGFNPVPRDYDGDGRADLAVYHAASGLWYVRNSSSGLVWSTSFGGSGTTSGGGLRRRQEGGPRGIPALDRPVVHPPFRGRATITLAFGGSGPPLPGDYDGDDAPPAFFHSATGLWYVRRSPTSATARGRSRWRRRLRARSSRCRSRPNSRRRRSARCARRCARFMAADATQAPAPRAIALLGGGSAFTPVSE